MKKIFLLITAIILFYAGSVRAKGITCEYSVDSFLFTVFIEDGTLKYTFNNSKAIVSNKLKSTDFLFDEDYKCLSEIYYNKVTNNPNKPEYTFKKDKGTYKSNLENPPALDEPDNGEKPEDPPGDNNGEGLEEIICKYSNASVSVDVSIQDGNLTYTFSTTPYDSRAIVYNKLKIADFSFGDGYKCLQRIYYNKTTLNINPEYTLKKDYGTYALELKNPGTSNGSGNGGGTGTTPGGNTGTGNNTENPSNNEVNVGFWGNLDVIQCGSVDVPAPIPPLVRLIVMAIKIVTPFVLIVMGMVDMLKAVIGSKDDEIKKEQQKFIKRVIAAVLLFFVVSILQFVIGFIAPEDTDSVLKCVDCLINDASKCN